MFHIAYNIYNFHINNYQQLNFYVKHDLLTMEWEAKWNSYGTSSFMQCNKVVWTGMAVRGVGRPSKKKIIFYV